MNHLLSMRELAPGQIRELVRLGATLKAERGHHSAQPLQKQCWGLIFSKSSTRTRVSFEVGIRELGGDALFLSSADIQLGRGEPIKDTARVLGRLLHGAVIRTFAQNDVVDFAHYSGIPTINALTDDEHPCQVLADLLTIQEKFGTLDGLRIAYVGDGDSNMARSWIWASEHLGFELVIAAPKKYQPSADYLAALKNGTVTTNEDAFDAVRGADVLYTDVFVSMGQEADSAVRLAELTDYQINAALVAAAAPGAIVMHCLPAYRGKEITEEILEAHAGTIFDQAENRLHAQKAILTILARGRE